MWCYCSARVWNQKMHWVSHDKPSRESVKQQHSCVLAHLTWSPRWSWPSPFLWNVRGWAEKRLNETWQDQFHQQQAYYTSFCTGKGCDTCPDVTETNRSLPETASHFYSLPDISRAWIEFVTHRCWKAKTQGSTTKQGRAVEEIV